MAKLSDKTSRIVVWNLEVPKPLDDAVEEALKRDWHRTKAEFIREAVRHVLNELGYTPKVKT